MKASCAPEERGTLIDVEVRRSTKRRRTVTARLQDGRLIVMIPSRMTRSEERTWVAEMQRRFERANGSGEIDLERRARLLATRYGLPLPSSIQWVTNQQNRWGSCTPSDRTIRLTARLAKAPTWVLDYVIVHELAHLRHPDHSPAFWKTVNQYPRTERARGFLIGWELNGGDATDVPAEADELDNDIDKGNDTTTGSAAERSHRERPNTAARAAALDRVAPARTTRATRSRRTATAGDQTSLW